MNDRQDEQESSRFPSRIAWGLLFVVVVVGLVAGGTGYYRVQIQQLRDERYDNLSAVGQLKVNQIAEWRQEQLRDVRLTAEDPLFREALARYLAGAEEESGRQLLLRRLQLTRDVYQFADALLLSPEGELLLSATPNSMPANEATAGAVAQAADSGMATLSALFRGRDGGIHLDAVSPVTDAEGELLAMLVLRVNASTLLFPLIQQWPTPSATAETLLVRQDGDDVLFLNELRHRSGASLSLRIPLTRQDLPAVQAIEGRQGRTEGADYRGVPVLAHLQPIPDSDWFLVAKWDESEIQAEIRGQTIAIVLVVTLFILLTGLSLAYLSRRRQASVYRDLYRAEKKRQQVLEEQRAVLVSIGDAVITTDRQGRVSFVNPVAETLTGYSNEEAHRRPLTEVFNIVNSHTRRPQKNPLAEVLAHNKVVGLANHTTLIARDGEEYQIADSAAPIRDADGAVSGAVLVFRDVTEAYQMEKALRESEHRFHLLFANAVSGVALHEIMTDDEGQPVDYRFLAVNAAFAAQTGLEPDAVIGRRVKEVLPGIEDTSFIDIYGRVALTGEPISFESYSPDLHRHYRINAYQTMPGQFAAIFQDITERKEAEIALQNRHRELQQVFSTMPEAMIYADPQRRIQRVNPAFVRIFGFDPEEVVGQETAMIYAAPEDYQAQGEVRYNPEAGTDYEPYEVLYRRRNGEIFVGETVGSPIRDGEGRVVGMLGLIRDVSARKEAEAEREALQAQLHQAQKLESIGKLAGGIAHDFNNILGAISIQAELAMRGLKTTDPSYESLQEILNAVHRSADLTRQLLAFARKQTITPRVVNLNQTIREMLNMLTRLIGEGIDLAWKPAPDLWSVKVDPAQLDQILANLCINARDAIDDVGKITVETDNVVLDEAYCRLHAGFLPGQYVLLAVSDTGHGMDHETVSHIFEPFFTTKETKENSGLGLATVFGIVKQNEGFINVYSEPGRGSIFRIYLPRHDAPPEQTAPAPAAKRPAGGDETILLVEDEPAILDAVGSLLESEGYTVWAARTPLEALRLAQEQPVEPDLLVTDIIMPEMNGRELAERLMALYPGLKCLYMSGYTANAIVHQSILDADVHFIEKPFTIEKLAKKVREIL